MMINAQHSASAVGWSGKGVSGGLPGAVTGHDLDGQAVMVVVAAAARDIHRLSHELAERGYRAEVAEAVNPNVAATVAMVFGGEGAVARGESSVVTEAAWRLKTTSWDLVGPDGSTIRLNHAEACFLKALAAAPGEAVARGRLITAMGHRPDYYDIRRLDTLVSRLRKKVGAATGQVLPIRAIHAYGYSFVAPMFVE